MSEHQIQSVLIDDGLRGVVRGMDREKYFRLARLNASSIKPGLIGTSEVDPSIIRAVFEQTRTPPSASLQDSFDKGSLTHCLIFEPETIVDKIAVWKGSRRAGGEWDEFEKANVGKLIMREADVREVQHAVRELRRVPQVDALLNRKHETELPVLGKIGRTYCKGLLDSITTDDRGPVTLIDLKTTSHGIDETSVLRTIRTLRYREQLSFYADLYWMATGIPVEAILLLFVSLDPLGVRLVKLTTSARQFGTARMIAAIEAVENCIDRDEWTVFVGDSICDVAEWEVEDLDFEGI